MESNANDDDCAIGLTCSDDGILERVCQKVIFSEKTYEIATSLFGIYERKSKPHAFHVGSKKVSKEISNKFHEKNQAMQIQDWAFNLMNKKSLS